MRDKINKKNNNKIIKIAIVMLMLMLATSMTACSTSKENKTTDEIPTVLETTKDSKDLVMQVGKSEVLREEVMIYLESSKQEIETLYGKEIWSYEINNDGKTYADLFKEQIIEKIKYIKIVCAQAETLEITLSEDEILDIDEYTLDFLEQVSVADLEKYGIEKETVKRIYQDNVLANKVYESVTLNVNTDVSDEEARQMIIQYIFLSKQGYKEDGSIIEYTEEEKELLYEKAKELAVQAREAEDFYSFAKEYSDNSDEVEMTIGKGDMEKELDQVAFLLRSGEVSDVIETDTGYFIMHCVSALDEEATAAKKEEIIKDRQEEAFRLAYESWEQEALVTLEEDVIKSILLSEE